MVGAKPATTPGWSGWCGSARIHERETKQRTSGQGEMGGMGARQHVTEWWDNGVVRIRADPRGSASGKAGS